ncbi:MAG: aminoacetone oxidase family FAD-binding enzyme [Candidatus Kapabacteria bacterium]|nr:aminoacetone oxidase family FAD-binding enzyme [Candidatus Kapabacteria bacterium]
MTRSKRIAVVGGGAAGMLAALAASNAGQHATLFERNKRLGIKILISGGGKCNITHNAPPRQMEEGFIRPEARFLRYAFHTLTSESLLSMLHAEGVETFVRPNGRVFPVSGSADDVLSAFERMLQRARVQVETNAHVQAILVENGAAVGIQLDGQAVRFDAVVVATGGVSYRKVGTTGDGIAWGESLGLPVVPLRAALAPIYFTPAPHASWQGVALRDVRLTFAPTLNQLGIPNAKDFNQTWRDDLLLTHRGASGPATLEISRAVALAQEAGATPILLADVAPDQRPEELLDIFLDRLQNSPISEIQTFVSGFVPQAIVESVLEQAGIEPGRKLGAIRRHERGQIVATLKRWRVGTVGQIPIDRGEVTAGGIALSAVDPTTMRSRAIPNLYFAGEALDVAGRVGGYNLQAAFSTGWVAGRAAAINPEEA